MSPHDDDHQPSRVDRLHRRQHVEATIEILAGISDGPIAGALERYETPASAI